MAVQAPLRSSTGSITFSHQTDLSFSADVYHKRMSITDSQPQRFQNFRNLSAQIMSPTSDIVGPSPVTSNGTETTEIEDDEVVDGTGDHRPSQLMMLRTNIPSHTRQSSSEEAISVIHAPESFHSWVDPGSNRNSQQMQQQLQQPDKSALGVISPPASEAEDKSTSPAPPPISTDVKPVRFSIDSATPQAQNLDDVLPESSRLRSSSVVALQNIPENGEAELGSLGYDYMTTPHMDGHVDGHMDGSSEIHALRAALEECWTLCNTLANLSSIHRERIFNSSGTPDAHEKAWKCCWKLCQRLYQSREEASENYSVCTNVDLCREFCQALFDVRQREGGDSVLRVSFELNNHLYSGQDWRNLPEPFKERTLDFYITLCHRLMKQRSELAEETGSLLWACWSLAEMLFSLRQSARDDKIPDEELLGSAVQACWELCDIFREGWTQVRPDRGTPRPSQITFQLAHQFTPPQQQQQQFFSETASIQSTASRVSSHPSHHSKHDSFSSAGLSSLTGLSGMTDRPGSVASQRKGRKGGSVGGSGAAGVGVGGATPLPPPPPASQQIPETPVTEFEDTPVSPESTSPQVPNIMVLGTAGNPSSTANSIVSGGGGGGSTVSGTVTGSVVGPGGGVGANVPGAGPRWPSSASNLSGYSQGSNKTSSTATTATSAEDINVTRIKMLILKAAMNIGFSRDAAAADGRGGSASLQAFVKSLPPGSFGSLPTHATLLQSYKNLVLADAFRASSSLPARGRRVSAADAAKSVGWMMLRSNQYGFLRDLFRLVFSFPLDEAESRKTSSIVV